MLRIFSLIRSLLLLLINRQNILSDNFSSVRNFTYELTILKAQSTNWDLRIE